MLPRARLLLPVVLVVALSGCFSPIETPMQPFNDCSLPEDQSDEQCMDELAPLDDFMETYEISGVIDGKDFSGLVCALNYEPAYRVVDADGWGYLDFQGYDNTGESGVVVGGYRTDGPDVVFSILDGGTFVRQGGTDGAPGTLTVTLDGEQGTDGNGSYARTVTGALTLTPIRTPIAQGEACGPPLVRVENLQEFHDTYEGPTGDGI